MFAAFLPLLAAATLSGPHVSTPDAKTLSLLHAVDLAEIAAGHLAEKSGQAPAVRALGKQLVRDFTTDDEAVEALAKQLQVPLRTPGEEARLQRLILVIPDLQQAKPSEFDHKYIGAVTSTHKSVLQLVHDAQTQATNRSVRRLLVQIVPQLKHHLALAKDLGPISH